MGDHGDMQVPLVIVDRTPAMDARCREEMALSVTQEAEVNEMNAWKQYLPSPLVENYHLEAEDVIQDQVEGTVLEHFKSYGCVQLYLTAHIP